MATATMSPMDALSRESAALEKEIGELHHRAETERRSLAALVDERTKLIEKIGLKQEDPQKAVMLAAQISGAESVIAGLTQLTAPKQQRLDVVITELRHLREELSRAEQIGEVTNLRREGEAILSRLEHTIAQAIGKDLDAYRTLRVRLDQIAGTARAGVFPIPAPALAAIDTRRHLDKVAHEKLTPIMKTAGIAGR
jgi:hypothetical protein